MKKYLIDSFGGGISKYPDIGLEGAFQDGYNLDFRNDERVLTCNYGLTTEWSSAGDTISFFVPSITGKLYGFTSNGKIYERDSSGNWTLKRTEVDGVIRGAAEWYLANGKSYLFWATNTKLHQKELPGASNWSDVDANIVIGSSTYTYPKTNLQDVMYHTMTIALGGLYIANGEKLAYVGYDGSYTNEALYIFKNEHIKCLQEAGQYLVFGTERQDGAERSSIYMWDTISTSWNNKREIYEKSINALVFSDIFLAQAGDEGKLFYVDMQTPLPIRELRGGGKVLPSAVTVDNGMAFFGVVNNTSDRNGIYSFGRRNKDENHTLNLEYLLPNVYALTNYNGSIFVSYESGTGIRYISKVNTSSKINASYYSLKFKPDKHFYIKHQWRTVNVYLKSMPSGCSIELLYRVDDGNFKQANLEDGTFTYTTTDGKKAIFYIGDAGSTFEFRLNLNSSGANAPKVEVIEVYFD